MDLVINPRGNGACPLCNSHHNCRVQRKMAENMDSFGPSDDDELEIVVYTCPYFKEKTAP